MNSATDTGYSLVMRSLFLVVCAVGQIQGCSSDNTKVKDAGCVTSEDCGKNEFCGTGNVCRVQCDGCGASCTSSDDCPADQFCTVENECQLDSRTSDGAVGDYECIKLELEFTPSIPTVVLLIDASHSMMSGNGFGALADAAIKSGAYEGGDCDNPTWRWNVVRNVLFSPENGVVMPLQDSVRFGMTLYTSRTGAEECPMLETVGVAFGNYSSLLAAFPCDDVRFETPTRETLVKVAQDLADLDVSGPKMIVLATDGEPDTCACKNWLTESGAGCDCAEQNLVSVGDQRLCPEDYEKYLVVQEAKHIHQDLGIQLEVINLNAPRSFSEDAASLADHLDDVAIAGGAFTKSALDGFDPVGISDAFQSVIDGVRSCRIDLDGTIGTGQENSGKVVLDAVALPFGQPDGWRNNGSEQIELLGAACETIKSGTHTLAMTFPCGAFSE